MNEKYRELINAGAAKDFWNTAGSEHYGIKGMNMNDGPHGVRGTKSADIIVTDNQKSTCFPTSSALASTWNPDLAERVGQAIAQEALDHGTQVLLGPGINLKRSPLGGRNFEYYSEDVVLTSDIASGFVNGVQKEGVAACLKHYALNEQEAERMTINCIADEKTLFDVYLKAFRNVIHKSNPMFIMSSYNKVNGEKVSESRYLLTDVLRNKLDFAGCVVSDWGAVKEPVKALHAGVDFDMPYMGEYQTEMISSALEKGELDIEELNERINRITAIQKRINFDANVSADYDAHYELAYETACESMVLLKNNKNKLPLTAASTIGIIGSFFRNPRIQGAGSSKVSPYRTMTPEQALIKNYPDTDFDYLDVDSIKGSQIDDILSKFAEDHPVLIAFTGLKEMDESEGIDRDSMKISDEENHLIDILYESNNDLIVFLNNGTAVSFDRIDEVDTILEMYLSGEAMSEALWDIVFGKVNPSGKLSETFPMDDESLPIGAHIKMNETDVLYSEGILNGYKYYDTLKRKVRFAFGHGLSYSKFKHSKETIIKTDKGFTLEVQIDNISDISGSEVIQVYVGRSMKDSVELTPVKSLCQFKKVYVGAGQSVKVNFNLDKESFSGYSAKIHDYCTINGDYHLYIGNSSDNIWKEYSVIYDLDDEMENKELMALTSDSLCKEFYSNSFTKDVFYEVFSYLDEIDLFDIILDMPLELICRLFPQLITKNTVEDFMRKVMEMQEKEE